MEFVSLQEGEEEISLLYWPDTQSISAWHADLEHQEAQVQRLYQFPPEL